MAESIPEPVLDAYSIGLMCASVCTNMSDGDATARMNLEHPTMIASPWAISTAPTFGDGIPVGVACEHQREGCRHILFEC